MLGLAYLFLSALTVGLYIAWLALLVWIVRGSPRALVIRAPLILVGAMLALLPLLGALVHPLVQRACSASGGVVRLTNEPVSTTKLVVSGRHYAAGSVMDVLATRQIDVIYVAAGAEYGDARRIATTAGIHDGRAFSLRVSTPNDPACAPYYDMLARYGSSATVYDGVCAALGFEAPPERFIRVSELHRRQTTWHTAFYPIDWEGIRLEQVAEGRTEPLLERREFTHPGLRFPLLLGLTPIGNFACRADKDARSVTSLLAAENTMRRERVALAMEQIAARLAYLEERYWGFPFPNDAYTYDIWVFDYGTYAKGEQPLDVLVNLASHDRPVLLKVTSNARANWAVDRHATDQMVIVQTGASREPQIVTGVAERQVWSQNSTESAQSPLPKYFIGRTLATTMASIKAERYCQLQHRATGVRTTIEVTRCPLVAK